MKHDSHYSIKRSSILFLQAVVVLIGSCALVALLWEPHLEGVNRQAAFFEVYVNDPFLAYVYSASVPFFVALYQGIKLLGYVGQGKIFSQAAVNALRTIQYCAFITAAAILAADIYLTIASHSSNDDPAGAVMLGVIASFVSVGVGATAAVFGRVLQNAVNIKSENDLTV